MPQEGFARSTRRAPREGLDVFRPYRIFEVCGKVLGFGSRPILKWHMAVCRIRHSARRLVSSRKIVVIADSVGPMALNCGLAIGEFQAAPCAGCNVVDGAFAKLILLC